MTARNLMVVKRKVRSVWHSIKPKIGTLALRGMVIGLLLLAVSGEQIVLNVSIRYPTLFADANVDFDKTKSFKTEQEVTILPAEASVISALNLANEATAVSNALTAEQQTLAARYSNLGFVLNPDFATKNGIDKNIVLHKKQKVDNYIRKYLEIAKEEARLYNIPVAITLAQGLLESNAGDSKLAQKENNHFGIKCNAKCTGCRCANYTDDSKYDMFRVFDSAWFSFREHSKLLQNNRYKHLLDLPRSDYRNWAYGLQAAGYATDKKYGEKLIKIVEALQLQLLDVV